MEGVGLTTVDAARITTGLTDQFVSDVDVQHCIGALKKKQARLVRLLSVVFFQTKIVFQVQSAAFFVKRGLGHRLARTSCNHKAASVGGRFVDSFPARFNWFNKILHEFESAVFPGSFEKQWCPNGQV